MTTKTRTILPALLLIAAALAASAMLFIGQPQMGPSLQAHALMPSPDHPITKAVNFRI